MAPAYRHSSCHIRYQTAPTIPQQQQQNPNLERWDDILETTIEAATRWVMDQPESEDVTVLIGLPKSGKSSLVNYLMGNQLIAVHHNRFNDLKLERVDPGSDIGPSIGDEPCNSPPKKYLAERLNQLAIWDTPGLDYDYRGSAWGIARSVCLAEIFNRVKSAKIVLVCDFKDLRGDSSASLLLMLKGLEQLLNGLSPDTLACVAIIFTKVPRVVSTFTRVDRKFVCEVMREKLLESAGPPLSQGVEDLLTHWTENPKNVGLFYEPTGVGPVADDIADNILEAISGLDILPEKRLKRLSPSFSAGSTLLLHEMQRRLRWEDSLIDLRTIISESVVQKVLGYSEDRSELCATEDELLMLRSRIRVLDKSSEGDFSVKIGLLKFISKQLADFVGKENLVQKAKRLQTIDRLLNTEEVRDFNRGIDEFLSEALVHIDAALMLLDKKMPPGEVQILRELKEWSYQAKYEQLHSDVRRFVNNVKRY